MSRQKTEQTRSSLETTVGKRSAGRPSDRCSDDLRSHAGKLWARKTHDRAKWGCFGEACTQRWPNDIKIRKSISFELQDECDISRMRHRYVTRVNQEYTSSA